MSLQAVDAAGTPVTGVQLGPERAEVVIAVTPICRRGWRSVRDRE